MGAIGRVLLMDKGAYSGSTVYNHLDWVRDNGAAWVCRVDGTVGIAPPTLPTTSNANWTLLAADGNVSGSIEWSAVNNKPFRTIGDGLDVDGSYRLHLDIAYLTGSNISYDNSGSSSTSDNVQDALDELFNGGGGGGMLPYLYIDSEAGATVTVNQPNGTVITPTAAGSGHWECELTGGYGTYVIHSVLSGQGDATQSLVVDTVKEYHVTDTHYDHTISFVAPSGSTVRIEGGTEIYTLTGTGSTQTQAVHSASTSFTITATMDGNGKPYTFTTPSTTGQTTTIPSGTFDFGTINVSVAADFVTAGSTITCVNGGTSCTPKTAASSLTFRVPSTGTWTISGEISGTPYSVNAEVTSLSTPVSVTLQTMASVTVTLYSATEDTVSFTDASGVPRTEVFASGQSSKSVTLTIDPSGSSITFTSSVALDLDNLDGSHYYSKTVTVTTATTDVYVMPDNALYWWGYNPDIMEQGSTANGWNSNYAGTNPPTFNTNDAVIGTASIAWGTKNPITGNIRALVIGIVDSGGGAPDYGYACATPSKGQYAPNGYTELLKSAGYDSLKLININNVSNSYYIHWANERSHSIKAIWYE